MLAIQRTPIERPFDFDERLRRTQEALRYVRVNDRGAISLLERETDPASSDSGPIYPSFAVLQLYLLNDRRFGARYVQAPLQFISSGVVDYERSLDTAKTMVRSLVAAARLVGDVAQAETAAAMRREPSLHKDYPNVYIVLRSAVLERLDALRRTVISDRLLEHIYAQRWRQNLQMLRMLGNAERQIVEWRTALKRGGELSRRQSNELAQQFTTIVLDQLLPSLLTEALEPVEPERRAPAAPGAPRRARIPPPSPPRVKPEPENVEREEILPEIEREDDFDDEFGGFET